MGMEVIGAEATPVQVKAVDGEDKLFQDKESKATAKEREEAAVFGLESSTDVANGATNGSNLAPPKDAVEEWPEPKQTHVFYFIKIRSYEDPKLKAKLEQADKDCQKKIHARSQIFEALRTKRTERSNIISELKPLTAENKQYNEAVNEKLKEMKPLQNSLGKFRTENNAMRAQSAGLCSSIEELEHLIKSLNDRICHESISLDEEKRLVREIKQLEGTRSKVIANAAKRAKIQDTVVERDAIQDQVKKIGEGIDDVRKERQAVRAKIKVLEDDLKAIDAEIAALQENLAAATARKDKAFDALNELKKSRDHNNASFHQNRMLLSNARDLSARSEVATLQELCKLELDRFMAQWCGSKDFRGDYEKRILPSLNSRQLSRDGRMRNPDEKPIVLETQPQAAPAEQEPAPLKMPVKQAKEISPPQADTAPKDEPRVKVAAVKVSKEKAAAEVADILSGKDAEPLKEKPKPKEVVDEAKLKEMKRQEEIEKNKLALERRKKQAEKQAVKAAARAEKEAEKKLKEKEKKARKKAAAAGTVESDDPSESDNRSDEAEVEEDVAPAPARLKKEQKENARSRSATTKTKALPPRVILRRKKTQSYWSWAAPTAALVAALAVLLGVLGYYQYYLPASASK